MSRVRSQGRPHAIPRVAAVICAVSVLLLQGCQRDTATASAGGSQVAARVNGEEISIHQVDLSARRLGALGPEGAKVTLDNMIEQELAAQAARKEGLEHTPEVIQAMEMARREVLARAYQDRLASQVVAPSDVEINQYFDAHPELFAQRHEYSLQELVVLADSSQAAALEPVIAATRSGADAVAAVRAADLRFVRRQGTRPAESLPGPVLSRVRQIEPGQSLIVPRSDGFTVLTLLASEPAPIDRTQARQAIRVLLTAESQRTRIREAMARLRAAASVELVAAAGTMGAASSPEPDDVPAPAVPPASAVPVTPPASDAASTN